MILYLSMALCGFVGYIIGLKLVWWFQLLTVAAIIAWMNSRWVADQEIGALLFLAWGVAGICGIAIGDIVWLSATHDLNVSTKELLDWLKRP